MGKPCLRPLLTDHRDNVLPGLSVGWKPVTRLGAIYLQQLGEAIDLIDYSKISTIVPGYGSLKRE
jgi:hypothetical protein